MSQVELSFMLRKWETSKSQITHVRKKVFMDEYGLPLNFLRHKDDAERYHVIVYDDMTGQAIGTGCIHSDGHIGRIAVLEGWRENKGIGQAVVSYLMHIAKVLKLDSVWLNAQMDTLEYFERKDFYPIGDPFNYCGMELQKIEAYLEIDPNKRIH